MGKSLISQKRGKGSSRYKAPSHRYRGRFSHIPLGKEKQLSTVVDIIHDPGHSAPAAVIRYEDGTKLLQPAAEGVFVGQTLDTRPTKGNSCCFEDIPEGSNVFNIELRPGDGGKLVRATGAFARLVSKDGGKAVLKLPSDAYKTVSLKCRANVGVVAGGGRKTKPFVKAGNKYHAMKARNKLWPRTKAVAMNACQHPFGGGYHKHIGKPQTSSRNAPPGQKVGYIAARRTGAKR